jgi:hypothetical protein
MDDFSKEKSAFKGLVKWILMLACGLLTALLITAGVYFKMDLDSADTITVEQKQGTAAE